LPVGKVYPSPREALAGLFDGATVLVGGFGGLGCPSGLVSALDDGPASGLTVISHGLWRARDEAGPGARSMDALLAGGQVSRLVSPMPFGPGNGGAAEERWKAGALEVEVVPQGVLAERLRAGGAGLGGVYLPMAEGLRFGEGLEQRSFSGGKYVFQSALRADFALLRAYRADTAGNLVFQAARRNWNPVMAMAAEISIVEVDEIVDPGGLDPELVITPGIFVNRVVRAD
jgi:3-oxoadipate CoA-transferase alpha subunit